MRNAAAGTNPPLCNTHVVVVSGLGQPQQQPSAVFDVLEDLLSGKRVTRDQLEDAASEIFGNWGIGGNIGQGYMPPVDGQGSGQRRGARGGQASPGFRPPAGWPWPFGGAQDTEPPDPQQAELEQACWRARQVLGFADREPIDREKLKQRHRELVKKYHPDRPGGDLAKMQAINEAVDVLESVMP